MNVGDWAVRVGWKLKVKVREREVWRRTKKARNGGVSLTAPAAACERDCRWSTAVREFTRVRAWPESWTVARGDGRLSRIETMEIGMEFRGAFAIKRGRPIDSRSLVCCLFSKRLDLKALLLCIGPLMRRGRILVECRVMWAKFRWKSTSLPS